MKNSSSLRPASALSCLFAAVALSAPLAANVAGAAGHEPQAATVSVFATGLNNPRLGPYTGSQTGARVSRLDHDGVRTTVADNFPSSQTSFGSGSLVSGVADVAFAGDTLYALFAGAGCSHGVTNFPNGIARIHHDGTWEVIADLGAFQKVHPVAHPAR